nr:hypothetical protein OG284_04045 [Streptomyces sp. NBC_01177]
MRTSTRNSIPAARFEGALVPARGRNNSLARLLVEAGSSAAELARDVNRFGTAQGLHLRYDRTSVAHWIRGSRPRPVVAELVAESLTRRLGRVVDVMETGLVEWSYETMTYDGNQGDSVKGLIALARADIDPRHRSALGKLAFRQRPLLDDAPLLHEPSDVHAAWPPRSGDDHAHRLRRVVEQFVANWFCYGGGHARASLASYIGEDVGRLVVTSASPAARRTQLSLTAQLGYLLGNMTADVGHPGLAQRYFQLSLSVSAQAADHDMHAITLRGMSLQAARMGAPRYAADLADTAVNVAALSSDAETNAFVLAQRAYTRALIRDGRGAYGDLREAERHLQRPTDSGGPFRRYPSAGLAYRKGRTLYLLGDRMPALRALRYAAAQRPSDEHRTRALSQARVALALMEQGHVDEACLYGRSFAEAYPVLRSHRATLLLQQLQGQLRQFRRSPEAAALLTALATLTLPSDLD